MKKMLMFLLIIAFIYEFALIGYTVYIDSRLVNSGSDAKFCFKTTTITYNDGNVKICKGTVYNVTYYNRDCFKATYFSKFYEESDISPTLDACKNQ